MFSWHEFDLFPYVKHREIVVHHLNRSDVVPSYVSDVLYLRWRRGRCGSACQDAEYVRRINFGIVEKLTDREWEMSEIDR